MSLTISEAARRAGVERKTIYHKVQKGLLSKQLMPDGTPRIELAELARIYPHAVTAEPKPKEPKNPRAEQQVITALRERVAALDADKTRLQAEVDREREERRKEQTEARAREDRYIDIVEKQNLQLIAVREPSQVKQSQTKPGFWARLAGRA